MTVKPLIRTQGITIIDFGAEWCQPCKTLLPILAELGREFGEAITIHQVDVDESVELTAEYGVMSMPTVIFFKDAQSVEKLVGLRPKEVYKNLIAKYMA